MKTLSWKRTAAILFLPLLAGISVLLYACGSGGGGGGTGSSGPGAGILYITDAPVDTYQQVILTIYSVEFGKQDGTSVSIFNDAIGTTYDVSTLNGILAKLPGASIPSGVYSRVLITVGKEAVLVDSLGNPVTQQNTVTLLMENPAIAANAWTTCVADKCTIEIAKSVTVVNNQSVVLDFDLKNFDYDALTHTLTAKVTLQEDCSAFKTYFVVKEDDYELKGVIKSKGANSFDISVIKAEHFNPGSSTVTVTKSNSTIFTCDDDVSKAMCGIKVYDHLQTGMIVKIHGVWNGQTMAASLVEVDNDNDLVKGATSCSSGCADTGRSANDYSGLTLKPETESNAYVFTPADYSITVNGKKVLITLETVVKVENEQQDTESVICAEDIPGNATKIEVDYSSGKDMDGNTVNLARKIEFKFE